MPGNLLRFHQAKCKLLPLHRAKLRYQHGLGGEGGSSPQRRSVCPVCVCSDLTENPLMPLPNGSFLGFTRLQLL